jgi:aminopeptidase YwaD
VRRPVVVAVLVAPLVWALGAAPPSSPAPQQAAHRTAATPAATIPAATTNAATTQFATPTPYAAAVHLSRAIGPRSAASRAERRAHRYVEAGFKAAGLVTARERFRVPGHGRSRDVIGIRDTRARCLTILMAHTDSVPPAPGADDNASGVGVLVALAPRLQELDPRCDVWLVATGAEERPFTGRPDHLGAAALVRRVTREHRRRDLRFALSLDEVGRGGRFFLQSPHPRPRPRVEGRILRAARAAKVRVRFAPDSGTGNSDHREFELSGLPGAKLGPWGGDEPCRHTRCDTWRRLQPTTLNRALAIAERVAAAKRTR